MWRWFRALLAAPGIDVNKSSKDGDAPLQWASRYGHVNMVRALLAAPGIDVNKSSKDGKTPLRTVLDRNRSSPKITEIAALLRQAGAQEPPK